MRTDAPPDRWLLALLAVSVLAATLLTAFFSPEPASSAANVDGPCTAYESRGR